MPKKKVNRNTKKYQAKELRRLKNKCLKLLAEVVKAKAGYKCEWCGTTEYLNCCHIESKELNIGLRYDSRNCLCLCAGNHKFKAESAHKSWCFTLACMKKNGRMNDLKHLLLVWNKPSVPITKEFLERKIDEFVCLLGG